MFFDQGGHFVVGEFLAKPCADALKLVEQGFGFTETLFNVGTDITVFVELRFLGQVADFEVLLGDRLAFDFGIDTGHDSQQSGLSGAI